MLLYKISCKFSQNLTKKNKIGRSLRCLRGKQLSSEMEKTNVCFIKGGHIFFKI